ncbi:MAG: RNA 2',3'-cyclic phosphodiesterase [Nitrospinae bacterium]|nr:RNA 2',3'-cyclic phosphodiesterase [Nitrospinota bacterium]
MGSESIRAFVSVNLDETLCGALGRVAADLKKTGADVKWVQPDNLHFTLKFLGEMENDSIEEIAAALRQTKQKKFDIEIGGLGAIPDTRRPRVIFADVVSGARELSALAEAVESALEPLGFEREARKFLPHLTLGRIKSQKGMEKLIQKMAMDKSSIFGKISVVRFSLMKSDLRPAGPIYTEIAEIPLNNGGGND